MDSALPPSLDSVITMPLDARTVPLDDRSAARLADAGLEYRIVDTDGEEAAHWIAAVDRGFLGERSTDEQVQGGRENLATQRVIAVVDPASPEPLIPVGTVSSWVMDLTVDADSYLPMWSISDVTVSATHRRRGIARSLLEGELRAAADAGVPIAGLTVSEATIYGRYGFGTAVHTATWKIDNRRAGWIGPTPTEGENPGRLDPVDRETLRDDLAALNETTRGRRPGDIAGWPNLWRGLAGLTPGKLDGKVRGVRYTDADGTLRGSLAYSMEPNQADFTRTTLSVRAAIADGPEAYAALWRYALQHDLVGIVTASLRSMDEPLRWLVADQRALGVTEVDHHWLRILDLPACLRARRLRVPGGVTLQVSDPLGFADGVWSLTADGSGEASVTKLDDGAPDSSHGPVELGIAELSAMLLGGVTASTLRAAGRIVGDDEAVHWLDLAFMPVTAPQLSYWY